MRRNIVIFVLIMLAVLVAWFFLVWTPQSNKIEETTASADETEQQARALRLEVDRLRELEKQAPQLRERAAKADTAIPGDPQLAQFILQVQEAADASGVDWVSVSPTPPAPPSETAPADARAVLEVVLEMSVEGGYFQVQDFITRLETLSRAVMINSVDLATGSDIPTRLEATLSMTMFVSAPAPPPTTTTPSQTGAS
jgi:Tfp pilus assembly protein PilO